MENTISERLIKLRGIRSQKMFAESLGYTNGKISEYESGKIKPSTDFYSSLLLKENVNINWILTGKGSMYNKPEGNKTDQQTDQLINRIIELETELNNLKAAIKNLLEKSEKPDKHSKKNYIIPLNNYSNLIFNLN